MVFRKESRRKERTVYNRQVHYYETDKMGIIHHSNYIRWFEEARMAYMSTHGVKYSELEALGVMIPVVGVSCTYKRSIKFDQAVEIDTWLSAFNGVRMEFQYEVYPAGGGPLLASGQSEHCFIDALDRNPLNLKKRLPDYCKIMTQLLKEEQQ